MSVPDATIKLELVAAHLESTIADILRATKDIVPGSMPSFKASIPVGRPMSEWEQSLVYAHLMDWRETDDRILAITRTVLVSDGSTFRLETKVTLAR